MRAILVGNYGVGNLGDEALRDYFLAAFPEVQWTVLSAHARGAELPRLPFGLRSVVSTPWWKTVRAIRQSDAMVFGGGSLFTDVESVRACFLWGMHAAVAQFFRKPISLAFQGFGPVHSRAGKWIAKWILAKASFVSVRDKESAVRIAEIYKNKKVVQSADPVLINMYNSHSGSTKNVINVIPRRNSSSELFSVLQYEIQNNPDATVCVVSMQPDDAAEQAACEALNKRFPQAGILPVRSLPALLVVLRDAKLVITERYHGALAALALGKQLKIIHQGQGDKHQALAWLVEQEGIERARQQLLADAKTGEEALRSALMALALH